jgi:DNA-binding MarR family transcriptional regulator
MSVSKLRRRRAGTAERKLDNGPYALPATTSRAPLLKGGSDQRFRVLVADLFTISNRMEMVREHLGRRLGISGPQYSIVLAVAHLQGRNGINVGSLAQALHVSSAFIATEGGKLVRRGLLLKRTNPLDRRGVLLSIAPAGRLAVDRVSAEVRAVNDLFFGALDATSFAALSVAAGALVESSAKAVRYITLAKGSPQSLRDTGSRRNEQMQREDAEQSDLVVSRRYVNVNGTV